METAGTRENPLALGKSFWQEDSKAFLDYYYFFKTRENSVYVVEEDEEIRSMLHFESFFDPGRRGAV